MSHYYATGLQIDIQFITGALLLIAGKSIEVTSVRIYLYVTGGMYFVVAILMQIIKGLKSWGII